MVQSSSTPSKSSALLGLLGIIAAIGVVVAGIITPTLAVASVYANQGIAMFNSLPEYLPKVNLQTRSSLYYTKSGKRKLLANFYNFNRIPVESKEISPWVKKAVISIEDPRFYTNSGVDLLATVRAVAQNAISHGVQSGSSTITMQLARNLLMEKAAWGKNEKERNELYREATEDSIGRKVQEMRYAIGLNKQYTKDEILTQYLNVAFFGFNNYGIQAASKYYFDKNANDLTIAQAALMGGIFPNASTLNPRFALENKANLKRVTDRRNLVLQRMLDAKYITKQQYDEAKATPIQVKINTVPRGCAAAGDRAYFCNYVVTKIATDAAFGKTADERLNLLRRGGLDIYTTLDPRLQKTASKAVNYWTPSNRKWGGAAITLQTGTGRILSMAQNRRFDATSEHAKDIRYTSVNYNTDQLYGGSQGFQPGSTYKLFTLLDWLKSGYSLNQKINAAPRTLNLGTFKASCYGYIGGTWKLRNVANFPATETVRYATANSVNAAFATMAQKLDLCDIQDMARKLGIHRANGQPLTVNQPAFIIGGSDNQFSPMTMATAYSVLSNDGKLCQPVAIDKIIYRSSGKRMQNLPSADCKQVISTSLARTAITALRGVMSASGSAANPRDGVPIAGKTGTTNDAKQTWFIGFTTKTTTASWAGNVSAPFISGESFSNHGVSGRFVRNNAFRQIQLKANQLYGGGAFLRPTGPASESDDPNAVPVPDVSGQSEDDAKSALQNVGLKVRVGSGVSSSFEKDKIVRSSPASGTKVDPGSTITIYPSSGGVGQMPRVLDMTEADAIAALNKAGFNNVSVQRTKHNSTKGQVFAVNATAGSSYSANSRIVIYVSEGQ